VEVLNDEKFIKNVERLIEPMKVSNLLFFQTLRKLLPPPALRRLLHRAARKAPYVGFVIDPYSLFLFFRLRDIEKAKSLLPDRYELIPWKIFADEEPDYYLGMGNLSTRASTFWGIRQEVYLIARDRQTGLPSWIFIDILSNTIIAVPSTGIADPNCTNAVFTTNSKGEVFLDIREDRTGRQFQLAGSISRGKTRKLDEPLWVMGNTSIGHCKEMAGGDDEPFAVIFDPAEVQQGLDIPIEDIRITGNTLFPGLADPEPAKVICFPFAQHYIADSPGCHTSVKDRDELISHYNRLADAEDLRTFAAKTIVVQIAAGIAAVAAVAMILALIL